ncbi:Heparin-sulfate lyase precursor [compost metagenome]
MRHAQAGYSSDEEALLSVAEADRIAAGSIPLFKGRRMEFAESGYDWNSWFFDSSQYQLHLTRFGYIKYLIRAYCLTADEKYAKCFNDMMDHFLTDNPAPLDDTFRVQHCTWEPLTVGVRMFNLPEGFITFFSSPAFTNEVKMKLIKSLHQHAQYVRQYHAVHGNHACMQFRGLLQIALLLPELTEAPEWLGYSLREFPYYIRQNVYEDGVQFEASPNYHLVVMRDLYEVVPLFRSVGMEPPAVYGEILEKMYVVLMHLLTPDTQLPRIGDTDVQQARELRNVMSLGAMLFGRPDFKHLGEPQLPFSLLFRLGPQAVEAYDRLAVKQPAETAACFPIGGYVLSRSSWEEQAMYMAMRAGVGQAGHTHADALSLVLYAHGRELVADSGIGLFEWNKERKYVVSTRAHNTVTVDGLDQHVRSMHWNTPSSAACKIWDFRSNGQFDYVYASHYGYTRCDDPVVHSRKVLSVKNRYWLVIDLFDAKDQHLYEQRYHLTPGTAVCDWAKGRISAVRQDTGVLLAYPRQEEARLSVEEGLFFLQGEYAPIPVAKRSVTSTGCTVMETVILPFRGGQPPEVAITRLEASLNGKPLTSREATGLRIEGPGFRDELCVYHGSFPVDAYLDHTGNPVVASLLPVPAEPEGLALEGRPCPSGIMIFS